MELNEIRDQMAKIRGQLKDEATAIRGQSSTLTKEGQHKALAVATTKARAQAAAMRERHLATTQAKRTSLERSLFGLPDNATPDQVIVWRDAQDRVETKLSGLARRGEPSKEERAMAMLEDYRTAGDHTMVRAVAQLAVRRGWSDVINAWTADNLEDESVAGMNGYLLRELQYVSRDIPSFAFHVSAPTEIGDLQAERIRIMADADGIGTPLADREAKRAAAAALRGDLQLAPQPDDHAGAATRPGSGTGAQGDFPTDKQAAAAALRQASQTDVPDTLPWDHPDQLRD